MTPGFARRLSLLLLLWPLTSVFAQDIPADYAAVAKTLNRTGEFKDKVFRIGIPRNDLAVTVAGKPTPTPFGFAGWIAMTKCEDATDVMMGDLVLVQDEVNPVISALQQNGLEVHALHNHFFFEEPRLFFLHIHGHGSAEKLANAVKPALDLIGKGRTPIPPANPAPAFPFDSAALDKIVGRSGDKLGTVYKYTVGRGDLHITENGAAINARMGLNSWASFAGTDSDAQIAGDIAMKDAEVNDVVKALRAHDLNVVAIHQHMLATHLLNDQPRVVFLHYWARGTAAELAEGFRAALDALGK